MLKHVAAIAGTELRIAYRNRWVAIAIGILVLMALILGLAGSMLATNLAADRLTVTVANLAVLSNYLLPLVALMLSFDAVSGEVERGTMSLLATYPVSRTAFIAGKFVAHLLVLMLAVGLGFGLSGAAAVIWDRGGITSIGELARLMVTGVALGAGFLGLGYATSGIAKSMAGAVGYAIGLWLVVVVLYDVLLLGMVLVDREGWFAQTILPWLLVLNPADAFRLLNLSTGTVAPVAGMATVASSIPLGFAVASLLLWPVLGFSLGVLALARREL